MSITAQQIIEKQCWEKQKNEEDGGFIYKFEDDQDTLKIFFADDNTNLDRLKNKLWNTYYSRILIYKQNSNYKVWSNSHAPNSEGKHFKDKSFDEKISPVEYWDAYYRAKSPKDSVDKKLEESILTVFKKLKEIKYSDDDAIEIILALPFAALSLRGVPPRPAFAGRDDEAIPVSVFSRHGIASSLRAKSEI